MRLVDEIHLARPFYGSRRLAETSSRPRGTRWNRKRVQRLVRQMGLARLVSEAAHEPARGRDTRCIRTG